MSDQKDPGIRLFGQVIPLAPEPEPVATEAEEPLEELHPPAAAAKDEVSVILSCVRSCFEKRFIFILFG